MQKKPKYINRNNFIFSNVFPIKESNKDQKSTNEKRQKKIKDLWRNENDIVEEKESEDETSEENIIYKYRYYNKRKREEQKSKNDDPRLTQPVKILIYSSNKKESIEFSPNKTIGDLIKYLNLNNYLSNTDKENNNFKVLYGLEQLKVDDERKIYEIVSEKNNKSDGNDNQCPIRIMIINKKNFLGKNKGIEKIYVTLENIPSFMDLSEQINIFIKKYKNQEIKYDIKYKNNCCIILFLSNEISFSFVTFMTNLKFTNKYYRKIIIKIKFNNNHLLKRNQNIDSSQKSLTQKSNTNSLLNTINNDNSKINLKYNINCQKSNSYSHISVHTEPNQKNQIYDYFSNRYSSINYPTPYEQEKIINKIENEKSKKKWMTNKGFFNGVNTRSFNIFTNPYNNNKNNLLSSIINNKQRKIFLNDNNI